MSVESKIEIRAPDRSWRIRKKSISAIVVYKDWMYCAGAQVEGSALKVLIKVSNLTSESYEMKRNVKLKTFCRIGRNDANLL
jgi:hypothetical protein